MKYAIGNGLRPDIWEEFQRRFNIGVIAEFFGATEANHLTVNIDGKVGASGRYTPFFKVSDMKIKNGVLQGNDNKLNLIFHLFGFVHSLFRQY